MASGVLGHMAITDPISARVPAHVGVPAVRTSTTNPTQPLGAAGLDSVQCLALMRWHAPTAPLQVSFPETTHDLCEP